MNLAIRGINNDGLGKFADDTFHNDLHKDLKADFVSTLEKCTEIEKSYLDNNKWYKTIGRSLLRLFAPLM